MYKLGILWSTLADATPSLLRRDQSSPHRAPPDEGNGLALPQRVGLVLGIIVAAMLVITITTLILLRIKCGPSVTFRAIFSRQPVPRQRTNERTPSDPIVEAALPAPVDASATCKEQVIHIIDPIPEVPSPRKSTSTSMHKEFSIRTQPSPRLVRTAPTPSPDRATYAIFPRASPTAPVRLKPLRTLSETNIKCEKLQILPYTRRRSSTRSSGTLRDRLYPPGLSPKGDAYVPDSPGDDHVIVLPSPRDLQKFRISVYQ
ncbi:hypothetical protein BO71DRAFT_221753 [Aspergillus ellipticus CBS 707.79]|uniref:Uncharacterized protein n=1 Tax=Aspergillus ellipticus CBS 707.79 TaxID=1448320 RepID=A0A319DSC6_9EURO|nr:hypothetical protein BO71DRAFT_221753 [Aspergillus ellipticus CBS 707.79]